jgi:hypothetical protein
MQAFRIWGSYLTGSIRMRVEQGCPPSADKRLLRYGVTDWRTDEHKATQTSFWCAVVRRSGILKGCESAMWRDLEKGVYQSPGNAHPTYRVRSDGEVWPNIFDSECQRPASPRRTEVVRQCTRCPAVHYARLSQTPQVRKSTPSSWPYGLKRSRSSP